MFGMNSETGVAVFAKAPIEGFAKTRLIPRLGAKAAADLQCYMIEQTVRTAIESQIGPVSLWCAPDCSHPVFTSLAAKLPIELLPQSGPDLGARMLNAFEMSTPSHPLVLIGCDCPVLRPLHLEICTATLRSDHDVVFIPTEDGGYALVAAAKPWPELFHGICWGSSSVMSETRFHATQLGLRISEPVMLWDIDTPEDFDRAAKLGLLTSNRGTLNRKWK